MAGVAGEEDEGVIRGRAARGPVPSVTTQLCHLKCHIIALVIYSQLARFTFGTANHIAKL
jgi:hypothetical protein